MKKNYSLSKRISYDNVSFETKLFFHIFKKLLEKIIDDDIKSKLSLTQLNYHHHFIDVNVAEAINKEDSADEEIYEEM